MNKEEFLKRLEQLLSDISEEERADALAFYRSYFEDAGIGNEASILEELESPEKVAEVIKKDLGVSETADAETPEEDVRSEKNETHTEGTSGDGQNAKTRMDDPYMNSLYGSSTYGSGDYEQKNTAYTGGTYGSQNTYGQIDIENLKKENQKNKTEKTVLWVILAVFDKPGLDHGCSGSGGDSCSSFSVCVCSGSQHCCSDGGVSDHWICIGRHWCRISFHKRRGSRSWTVRRWTFGSCAWSTCSVACGMVLWLVCPMGSERHCRALQKGIWQDKERSVR